MLNALAVVVSIVVAIAVARYGQEPRVKPFFVLTCLACACLCAGLWLEIHVEQWALFAARVNMTAALVLAGSAVIATRTMARLPFSRPVALVLAVGAVLNVATVWATDLYFADTLLRYPWGVFVGANPRFLANPLLVAALAGYAVVLLARQYRSADPLEKNRTKYLLAAFSVLSLSILDYVPHFGVAPLGAPTGAVFITLFLFLFGYACLRYRLIVFRELLGRAAGLVLAFAAMGLAYALALEAAQRGGAGGTAAAPLAGTIAAAAVYALIGRAAPNWTERLLGASEPDYARAVRDYSDAITSNFDEAAIVERTRSVCASTFDARGAALLESETLDAHPMFALLAKSSEPFVELAVARRTHAIATADPYELFFPIWRHDRLAFALALEPRSDGRMYSARALDALRTLANVLGIAIVNARSARELAERLALLEAKNSEISVLNDELRRQVTDRSQKLADALQRIGALPARTGRIAIGETIDGRYRVVRELGAGGMGAVYEVVRTSDAKKLALKILTEATTGVSLARLAREAEVAGTISHPNLVSIVDVDVSHTGELYIVMELVEGRALSDARASYGDVAWILGVLEQIAEGLAALHLGGVVHRDLKPANVLLAGDARSPLAKIADFGVARIAGDAASDPSDSSVRRTATPLTETGLVVGTPLYMAPELVFGGKDARPSSDIWSFGVLAYELVVGTTPFQTSAFRECGKAQERATAAFAEVPELPRSLAEIFVRALSLAAAERPTAAELGEALRRARPSRPARAADEPA